MTKPAPADARPAHQRQCLALHVFGDDSTAVAILYCYLPLGHPGDHSAGSNCTWSNDARPAAEPPLGPVDTYTPILWLALNDDGKYEEYIRARNGGYAATVRAEQAEARLAQLVKGLENCRRIGPLEITDRIERWVRGEDQKVYIDEAEVLALIAAAKQEPT